MRAGRSRAPEQPAAGSSRDPLQSRHLPHAFFMTPEHPDQVPVAIPLLGRDDPPPFVVLHEHGAAPALVVCDHASRAFPRGMKRLGLPELPSWQHIAWDIGAGELARGIANLLDAPAVLAGYSRLIVDCNRRPDDPEAFRSESDGWVIPGNQSLDGIRAPAASRVLLRPVSRGHRGHARGFPWPRDRAAGGLGAHLHARRWPDSSGPGTSACCGTRTNRARVA